MRDYCLKCIAENRDIFTIKDKVSGIQLCQAVVSQIYFLQFHNLDTGFPPVDLDIDHEEERTCPDGISFSRPRPTLKAEGWVLSTDSETAG